VETVNSDDPSYFGGYILANYCAVQEAFDLTVDEWEGIVTASIEGSWCAATRKEEMHQILDTHMKAHA
jgi:adenosine deaminase